MKTIGIIGGLGPQTTAEFYLEIGYACSKLNNIARPGIVIASVPLPFQIEEDSIMYNKNMEKCIPFLINEAKRLEQSGVDFIVMPCNSLHAYIKEIRHSVSIPVLSIIEETVQFLKDKNMNKVGIISTLATVENKLYENAFAENGIKYVTPNGLQQAKIGKIIINLVTGKQKNEDRNELISVIESFDNQKLDCVILACTDLQLLIPEHKNLKIFDTMKILVEASAREMLK